MLILGLERNDDKVLEVLFLKLVFKSRFKQLFWTYKHKIHKTYKVDAIFLL